MQQRGEKMARDRALTLEPRSRANYLVAFQEGPLAHLADTRIAYLARTVVNHLRVACAGEPDVDCIEKWA